MSVQVERKENNKVELKFNIAKEKFIAAMDKAYLKNAQYFNVPGFRKGKVPKAVAIKHYGEGILFEEAFNIVADEEYRVAIEENNLEVVSEPEVDIKEIGTDKDLEFTAIVYVKPEVKLKKYKGIEIEKVNTEILEEDINKEIEKNREKNARTVTVENRPLKEKDISTIDFEGFTDGIAFPGGKGEKFELTIGSGQFIPGFEEQLIGMNIGDEKEITVKFPEQYHSEDLAGKDAMFKVKLHEIKEKQLPDLDDEFVKDVSEFNTLEEYKSDVRTKLEKSKINMAEREKEVKVINELISNLEADIPESMINAEIENMMKEFENNLKYQGFTIEKYAELLGTDINGLKEQFKEEASKNVKTRLAFEYIQKEEKIDANQEEIEARVKELVKDDDKKIENYMKNPNILEYVKKGIANDKIIKLLVSNAIEK